MKFSCERCQTRYSIGDEKVKGKVLKIRCKTCGNIIVVREQIPTVQGEASGFAVPQQREAAMQAAVGAAAPAPAPPSPPSQPSMPISTPQHRSSPPQQAQGQQQEIDWYVAIKGKQHGPAKAKDIGVLFRDGKISERTYLWHEKLPAWTRLKDLPEFAALVAEGPAPKRPPPPPPEDGAEIVNFEQARAQRQQQQNPNPMTAPLGPVTSDPFATVGGVPGMGGDNAPRESTRVFIMQAGLQNRAQKQKVYAGVAIAVSLLFVLLCVVDYQFDILGLKKVVEAVAVSTGIKEEPVEPGAEWGDEGGDPAIRCKLMPNFDDCMKKEKKRIAAIRKKKKDPTAAVSEEDLKGAFGSAGDGSGTVAARTGVDENGFVKVGAGLSDAEIKAKLGGGKGGPSGPRARVETPNVAGTTIDAENAGKVVREGQPGIQTCVEDAMKQNEDFPSRISITLSITLKGTVERAVVNNAVVQASGLGSCLSKTAKRWKFAPPTEPADLEIPLVLK